MGKSPRKQASLPQTKSAKQYNLNVKTAKKSSFGGKATKYYNHNNLSSRRRFSIVDSSSDSERTINNTKYDDSDESSLTAVSEEDSSTVHSYKPKALKSKPKKSLKLMGRKVVTRKRVKRNLYDDDDDSDIDSSQDDDDDENNDDDDEDDEDEVASPKDLGLEGLYSLMNTSRQSDVSGSEEEDDDEDAISSSDDDVDFVKLQAERKAARVALKSNVKDKSVEPKEKEQKQKFGRRKSNVTLPEDINFTFDIGDLNDNVAIDDDLSLDDQNNQSYNNMDLDEDVGEEISPSNDPIDITKHFEGEFDFDSPMIPVPRIKDEDLNSDDEYAFDDNELLATLHDDDGMDEYLDDNYSGKSRNNSMGSLGDDEFLKEEEKFLVNEFENNGFDDEVGDFSLNEKIGMDSFNEDQEKHIVQYESTASESGCYEDEDEDEDEFEDFVDFDVPIFDEIEKQNLSDNEKTDSLSGVGQYFKKPNKVKKKKKKTKTINSDEDDDSYLWNYFFSSGESEEEIERYNDASEDEAVNVDHLFADLNEKNRKLSQANIKKTSDDEEVYESGDSTDEDLNLPKSSKSKIGSKKAKEVLSSKTADYRPPILGTWVAVDSKPFGIIDGLSTRTLVRAEPRRKVLPDDELALGLDELLNVSELDDDDENDIKIWRDFNSKKVVPLGAFRNKSTNAMYPNPEFNYLQRKNPVSKVAKKPRRNSVNSKPERKADVRKQQKRRSSESVEGFRPTKSGLFSEHALADIEEVLGDDNEFLALIKGI